MLPSRSTMLLCVILREKSGLVASLFKFVTEKLINRKRHSLPNTNTQNSWKHAFVQPHDTINLQYCPRYLEKLHCGALSRGSRALLNACFYNENNG